MLGYLAVIIIFHSIYSALRWRKFLQGNSQQIQSLPLDIITQAIFGVILSCLAIAASSRKLKKITKFQQSSTYDKALERKNFKNYDGERGKILQEIVKKRLNIQQFVAPA